MNSPNWYKGLVVATLIISGATSLFAQEDGGEKHIPIIRGAIMMGYSHVPKAFEGETKVDVLPTWGIDFDYFFHARWSVAVQGEITLQNFEIEHDEVLLERSFPFAIAAVAHYHAKRHWSFYAGPGIELDKNENLLLLRLGSEYSFEISENFEIALNFIYENKFNTYDTWIFGVAFNKKLWEKQ